MVVFTCNFCGDSVNKPKADKHITIECKKKRYGFASLCCVDCLKDFDFSTYHSHTKCMTEEERYSAPGFVSKPSSGKGERKQTSWIDTVPKLLEKATLTKPQRSVLEFINGVPNIPRKKTKFLNFMSSSMGYRNVDRHLLEAVFSLLEAEFNAAKSSSQTTPKDPVEKPSSDASQQPENTDDIENGTESQKVKKKKKDKGSREAEELAKENTEPREVSSENVDVPEDILNGCDEQNEDEGFTAVKKSKKKKKKEKDDDAPMEIAEPDANENAKMEVESTSDNLSFQNDARIIAKSRGKKKHKNKENISVDQTVAAKADGSPELANAANTDPGCPAEDVDRQSEKKKKKRKLQQVDAEDDIDSKRSRIETIETESNPKFSWSDVVKTLLEKSKNHEISVKRITKKVVAEYQSFYSTSESYEDIAKKFHKKVKKLPFVVVSRDRVQLYVE